MWGRRPFPGAENAIFLWRVSTLNTVSETAGQKMLRNGIHLSLNMIIYRISTLSFFRGTLCIWEF